MAFDTVTDKTQQPPANTGDGGSLYDQIMSGPPAAAAPDTAGVKTADVPPAPGAAPVTQDRTVAPPADEVVPPKADAPPAPGASSFLDPTNDGGVVPAANGDKPVAPPDSTVVDNTTGTAKDVPPPGAGPTADVPPAAAPTDVPPAAAPTDVPPGAAVAPPVEGVEDRGNCNFKPDYEYKTEQGRAWKAESDQQRQKHIELNEKGRYQVQHGDCLETIAERNLKDAGLAANRTAIKAEVAEIVAANKNRYPSLDCNNEFLSDVWTLTLPRHQQGDKGDPAFDATYNTVPQRPPADTAQPPRVERPPVDRPPVDRPPAVEVMPPQRDTRGRHHHAGVVIEQADTVNIIGRGDAPRAVPSSGPYYPEQDYPQDRPVYVPRPEPQWREPVYRGDEDYERYRRPPIIIDARIGNRHGGFHPSWGRQQPWFNDDCFGTGGGSWNGSGRWNNGGRWGGDDCDNRWRNGGSRVAIDFGMNDFGRMNRSMPHYGRPPMPYYRGGNRSGISLNLRF